MVSSVLSIYWWQVKESKLTADYGRLELSSANLVGKQDVEFGERPSTCLRQSEVCPRRHGNISAQPEECSFRTPVPVDVGDHPRGQLGGGIVVDRVECSSPGDRLYSESRRRHFCGHSIGEGSYGKVIQQVDYGAAGADAI